MQERGRVSLAQRVIRVVNLTGMIGIRAKHNSSPPPCGIFGKQNACLPCSGREMTRGRGRRKDILGRLGTIFIDSLTEGMIRPFVLYQDIMNGSLFLVTYCFQVVFSVLYLWFCFPCCVPILDLFLCVSFLGNVLPYRDLCSFFVVSVWGGVFPFWLVYFCFFVWHFLNFLFLLWSPSFWRKTIVASWFWQIRKIFIHLRLTFF